MSRRGISAMLNKPDIGLKVLEATIKIFLTDIRQEWSRIPFIRLARLRLVLVSRLRYWSNGGASEAAPDTSSYITAFLHWRGAER